MAAAVRAISSLALGLASSVNSCLSLASRASRTGAQVSACRQSLAGLRFHDSTQERHRTAPMASGPDQVAKILTPDELKKLAADKNLGNGADYQRFLPVSTARPVRGHNQYPFAASGTVSTAGNRGLGAQQVRTIMVEVRRNDLDRAIRRWRRKCKEENLRALKDREYYIKPSEKRKLALKERDRRIAKKAFKQKLNWIMGRRQRGF